MIITKTPLRISFVGGGSDLKSFYKHEPGAVISTTINKYVYVAINKKFDDKIRMSYSETETVDDINELKHNLARETLKYFKVKKSIEISSIGDIPSGTGLGSSGAYTVGLINALSVYKGLNLTKEHLADIASIIEIDKVGRPIGKQDQYAESYGGLNYIQFNPDGSVLVEPITLSAKKKKLLENNLLLFYTGKREFAEKVLAKQNKIMKEKIDKQKIMSEMVAIAKSLKDSLNKGKIEIFGELLHKNWILKKKLTGGISNPQIDAWYETALQKGATGGKICGAGGRGFLLLYAPPDTHKKISRGLSDLQQIHFSFEEKGSTIIYNHS
jgi:D-glycero-alpha-D-manno-heptose-7-phosphate kinase